MTEARVLLRSYILGGGRGVLQVGFVCWRFHLEVAPLCGEFEWL